MKTKVIIAIIFIVSTTTIIAQNRIRRDYTTIEIIGSIEKLNGTFPNSKNTFIFNYDENYNVLMIDNQHKQTLFIRVSKIQVEFDKENNEYSAFTALDEDGDDVTFQVYTDPKIGMNIIQTKNDDWILMHFNE